MRPHKSAATIFIGVAFLTFCTAGGRAAAQSATRDLALSACDAFSKVDVEQALGISVFDGRALVRKDDVQVCSFAAQGSGRSLVLLRRLAAPDWKASQYRRMKNAGSFRPVAGLGDQAFLFDTRQGTTVLCVFYRGFYLQISASNPHDGDRSCDRIEGLCRRLLKGLEPAQASNRIIRELRGQ